MKKRPLVVVLFAGVCALYPVLMIVQTLLIHHLGMVDAARTFLWPERPLLFGGENLLATALAWFAAYAVYHMKGWSWWLGLGAAVGLVGYNALVFLFNAHAVSDAWLWIFTVITTLPLLVVALLLQREIRAPYFNPRVRWWESEPRYPFDVEVSGGGQALDISRSGMFVKHEEPPEVGTQGEWAFEIDGRKVRVEGEVSWVTEGDTVHPAGFGLQFNDPDERDRIAIDTVIARQRARGHKQWGDRAVRYPLDIHCDDGAVVLDISAGGMFVQSKEKHSLGDTLSYRIRYGNHEIPTSGRVVWICAGGAHPAGYGVKFSGMDADARSMLDLMIKDLWKANLEPVQRQH